MKSLFTGLWHHRDFLKLWTGETISLLGSQITLLALPLTAESVLQANAQQMGILGAAQFAPFLLFGLFAGVWIDRSRRRPILIAGDLGRALLLLTIPLAAIAQVLGMVQLYVVSFLVGILTLFFDVAYQAYLPSLVEREQLVEGNSKLEVSRSVAQIAGPGIAGALIKLFAAPLTIALDSLSFFISALFLWRIGVLEPAPTLRAAGRNIWHEIGEGLQVVFGNRILRSIAACTASANLFGMFQVTVLILFLRRELGMDALAIGTIFGLGSLGGLAGALFSARVARWIGLGPAIISASLLFGLSAALIPLANSNNLIGLLLLTTSQLIAGFSNVVYNVNQVSLRQAITPDRLQGRMNASMRFVVWGIIPIGSLIGGFLGEHIGLRPTLWLGAIGIATSFLWALFSPVRTLKEQPAPADAPPADSVAAA